MARSGKDFFFLKYYVSPIFFTYKPSYDHLCIHDIIYCQRINTSKEHRYNIMAADDNKKRNPAKVQVDPSTLNANTKPEQTGQTFNIWYSKWTGGENNGRAGLVHAKTRCHVARDSGYTKADKHVKGNALNTDHFFCLYFARGCCCNGRRCEYLHRVPRSTDKFPQTVDCFGREKFSEYREDMSGVGSFGHENRTLYVGRISDIGNNVELRISKCFGEFGNIEHIRVVKDRKIAFVRYRYESQAQFAKEAMYCQSLDESDENEVLNVRWALEDPNPRNQKRLRVEAEQIALKTAQELLKQVAESHSLDEASVDGPEAEESHNNGDEIIQKHTKAIEAREHERPVRLQDIISNSNLESLGRLRIKKRRLEHRPTQKTKWNKTSKPITRSENKPETIQSMLSGYSSDSDDTD